MGPKATQADGGSSEDQQTEREYADKNFRVDVDEIVWVLENEELSKTGRAKLENLLARGLRQPREAGSPEDEYATTQYRKYRDGN
jgi:hypothetical protein